MHPDHNSSMPLFFLSYAHSWNIPYANGLQADPNSDARFFHDLSRCVLNLVDRRAGVEPGFMDRSIQGGRLWTEELLHALGTCQVFVALLSVPYMTSEWCAMEWDAFSQRAVTKRSHADPSTHETCIIPVVWAPVPSERVPECVRKVKPFSPSDLPDPDTARRYEVDGIFGLLEFGLDYPYRGVVYRLAQRIAELCDSHEVEPRKFAYTELRNIFQEQTVRTIPREQACD